MSILYEYSTFQPVINYKSKIPFVQACSVSSDPSSQSFSESQTWNLLKVEELLNFKRKTKR